MSVSSLAANGHTVWSVGSSFDYTQVNPKGLGVVVGTRHTNQVSNKKKINQMKTLV